MSFEVKALKPHHYGGRPRKVGDTYQVIGQSQLNLVRALGWSEKVPTRLAAAPAPAPSEVVKSDFASGGLVPHWEPHLIGEHTSGFPAPSGIADPVGESASADVEVAPKEDPEMPPAETQIPPPADAPTPPPPADVPPADPVPDAGTEKPAAKERPASKRTYQRRDLAAE
jgi:hypothetical protein